MELKEEKESFKKENFFLRDKRESLKRKLEEMTEMYERVKLGKEKLEREKMQNNVEQDTENKPLQWIRI